VHRRKRGTKADDERCRDDQEAQKECEPQSPCGPGRAITAELKSKGISKRATGAHRHPEPRARDE